MGKRGEAIRKSSNRNRGRKTKEIEGESSIMLSGEEIRNERSERKCDNNSKNSGSRIRW